MTLYLSFGKPTLAPFLVPPLLAGVVQCYWTQRPGYALSDLEWRQILYDYAYLRPTWTADKTGRAEQILAESGSVGAGTDSGIGHAGGAVLVSTAVSATHCAARSIPSLKRRHGCEEPFTMPIRAVVFDRDGVLTYFDTKAVGAFVAAHVPLSVFELFHRWQQLGETIGFPTSVAAEEMFLRTFWAQIGVECRLTTAQIATLSAVDYTRLCGCFPRNQPGIGRSAHAGAADRRPVQFRHGEPGRSLAAAGLSPWIDTACAATVIGVAKPAVAAYHRVAQALAVPPGECAFFDDEPANVAGGRRAGMHSFLVDRRRSTHDFDQGVICDLRGVAGALALLAAQETA